MIPIDFALAKFAMNEFHAPKKKKENYQIDIYACVPSLDFFYS